MVHDEWERTSWIFNLGTAEILARPRDGVMDAHVYPAVEVYDRQDQEGGRWKVIPVLEELKARAKSGRPVESVHAPSPAHDEGPFHGAGLTNLDYALCLSRWVRVSWASEVFNCSAPDTGNMEVLHFYGTPNRRPNGSRLCWPAKSARPF